MALEKASPIPLYYQLAELLREQIRQGELVPGDQVPSERALSERYAISRMTARQAIAYLVREGAVVARHGLGTFVAAPKITHDALHLLGFTEEVMRQGRAVVSQVIERSCGAPSARVAAALRLAAGASAHKIVRLRLAEGERLMIETSYVPEELCPDLGQADLASESLYTVLAQRAGVELQRAHQWLEATVATDYEAELLGVAPGAALILLEGTTFASDGRPAEHFKALYRGDRFKFAFASERGSWVAEPAGAQISVVLA